ncbi:MAG: S-methyl-5-thioribose-1-phosphate isomerase [Thermodesulfovibrionales bacterium]|nr:S-methyl-5-thioribose-1-phosphate isomerase [Thermodesulfovibrionales bacterium]
MVKAIEFRDNRVIILDQTKLPFEISYIECTDYQMIAQCIKKLCIRGAPAIGIASAMAIALGAQDIEAESFDEFVLKIQPIFDTMLATRPTAVNIRWACERMRDFLNLHREETITTLKDLLIEEANKILQEDIEINKAIGKWGAEFIKDGDTILTHCNAGSLATGGYGTATAPMIIAKEQGKNIHVIVDETRPLLQGARLTAWELIQTDIPVTLITDSSAGALMRQGTIDLAIVGTDRTTKRGDVANKIGTYTVAVLCKENNIPFYVAAPLSSIDFSIEWGDLIPIEERSPQEVTTIGGKRIAPEGVNVINRAFDITPSKYVTAFFTEKGVFKPRDLKKLISRDIDIDSLRLKPYEKVR